MLNLNERAMGSLMGVFIGDGFALPCEGSSPDAIRKHFGYVDRFVSNRKHPFRNVARQPKGTISDDSQLTLAMMDALKNDFDINKIKHSHIDAYNGKWGPKVGWGKSTRVAVEAFKRGDDYKPLPETAGNGPVIKIAPLAIRLGSSKDISLGNILRKCILISTLTHEDPRCVVAAFCHTRMLIRALQRKIPFYSRELSQLFINDAKLVEAAYCATDNLPKLSERMEFFLLAEKFNQETSVISSEICTSQSSFIYNSYPFVAYCVAKYLPYRNFKHALFQTANAGADADSNSSMVSSIVGAALGAGAIPTDLFCGLRNWKMLLKEIKSFLAKL